MDGGGIFVSLKSWVKYGRNTQGVGNVGEKWGSVFGYRGGEEEWERWVGGVEEFMG